MLSQEGWRHHLPEDFHRFDVLVIDSLLHPEGNEGMMRRAATLAKIMDRTLNAVREKAEYEIRVENAKRREQREKDPRSLKEQRLIVGSEENEWVMDVVMEQWAAAWGDVRIDVEEARHMWEILRYKVWQNDGYWKERRLLESRLSVPDRQALEMNATGVMRYAHILYQVGTYVGKYLSFLTGKPTPSMVIEGEIDEIYSFSLCKYCGEKMQDMGKQKRRHCGKPDCKKDYDRLRKRQQRSKMPA